MPSPCRVTSCEVIPPLARTTQALGCRDSRTVRDRVADTARATARLPAPSRPVDTTRLVYSSTSEARNAAATCRAVPAATSPPPTMAGTSSSTAVIPPRARSADSWRLVWPTCDPTTTRPCPPCGGRPAGQMSAPRSGARGPMPASARTKRGAGAEQERRARTLGHQHPGRHRLQVGVFGGVDHGPAAIPHPGQQLADPLRAAEPDVGQADAANGVPPDRAAALLRHEVTQVRCAVAERANSVSPTGTRRPPTRAQWMSPAVSRPASRNASARTAHRHARLRLVPPGLPVRSRGGAARAAPARDAQPGGR